MENRQLKALVTLLDDPDREVFEQVESELINSGPGVIPFLEESWQSSPDDILQSRLETVIEKIQFEDISKELFLWKKYHQDDLLKGMLILNRFQYPSLDEQKVYNELSNLSRQAWLQMMYDMSPKEHVKFLNGIIFQDFGLSGNVADYHDPQNSYLSRVLERKKGNPLSICVIYAWIAQKLDLPIYGVNLPRHFMLAYMDESDEVMFYINGFNRGQLMKPQDIAAFLKHMNLPEHEAYTKPCDNLSIIKRVIRNLISSYKHHPVPSKLEALEKLMDLMEP